MHSRTIAPSPRQPSAGYTYPMSSFLFVLLLIAMFATLGVLFFGLISMARGGEFNRRNANKLMRLRVLMQFVAVVLFVLLIFTLRH